MVNDLETAQTFNPLAFILNNGIKNENDIPLEFKRHQFLIDPYMDETPMQVVRKAAQVGWSTLAILRAFHLAYYKKANIIYTLPSKSIVKDFVTPKVDPLISNNTKIKEMVGDVDSMGLKKVGDRFVYFRSSWDEASGISISAHILISDEVDRSNQLALKTYKTRLDGAKIDRPDLGWWWQFSNPSIPGYGVDELWGESDQKHWKIKCSRCNEWQSLVWPDNINIKEKIYICSKCERPLSEEDRIRGEWVRMKLNKSISGYWLTQMMSPWIDAEKIILDSKGDQAIFHNFTLGLPYQPKDQSVSRETIIKCIVPTVNPRVNVAMGVDNGIVKHYVIGNQYGIFRIGKTEDWQEIEDLRNQYDAYMVIDANPYPTKPKELAKKYPGKVFIHYYGKDKHDMSVIRWGEGDAQGVVYSDRTKIIDAVVAKLNSQEIYFNLIERDLEEYIYHWTQMFRVVEEKANGITLAEWRHPEGKPDHYSHAHIYQEVAMQKTITQGGVVTIDSPDKEYTSIQKTEDGSMRSINLNEVARKATHRKKNWKSM